MNFYKYLLLTTLYATFFASCSALKDLTSIQKPDLSVNDVRISDASLSDLELTFDIEVDNPNSIAINLTSYNYDFLISDRSFVSGDQSLSTEILSTNKSIVQIPVRFTYEELFKTFSDIRDQDETEYELNSVIGVNLPVLGFTEIPLKKSGVIPVIKPPKVSVSRLSVKNLSFTKADLELILNIDNPNAFGISLRETDYTISINGLESISGKSLNPIEIKEKNSGTISVPVSLNFIQLGRSAYNLIKEDQPLEYILSGSTDVESTLPFFKTSSYNFDRSGTVNIFNN
ncbi:MAG: LEA type 2 family protein [Balneola sp.]|nr:LEA type 2 family protein [Balneola sp.]MBO6709974.1 LEA type 2 family protein [Balneola sp.]MBO6798658.1 LEA type 2 family protein [Balneola sp.]MBO6871871.1 LEA type 2 family protein [Balneola sp.]